MSQMMHSCRLIEVGHDFCGSPSNTLQESLKKQCWSYFQSYHLERLEEIKMHLENEGWALCPVKPTFKVPQLVEFRRLNRAAPKRFSSPKKKESSSLTWPQKVSETNGASSKSMEGYKQVRLYVHPVWFITDTL